MTGEVLLLFGLSMTPCLKWTRALKGSVVVSLVGGGEGGGVACAYLAGSLRPNLFEVEEELPQTLGRWGCILPAVGLQVAC